MERSKKIRKKYYAAQWPQEQFIVPMLNDVINTYIDEFCSSNYHSKVLDVGCGAQPFRQIFEEKNCIYYGLDIVDQTEGKTDFICQIDEVLPRAILQLGGFEFILCSEVLEHVADWDTAFANFEQLLSVKGTLLITCPHFYQLHEEPYDFWRPTPHAISHFAAKHNMIVREFIKGGSAWDVLGTLLANIESLTAINKNRYSWFVCKVLNFFRRKLFNILSSRYLQRNFTAHSPLYLSNIAILEKKHKTK